MKKILIIADGYKKVETEKICLENYDFDVTVEIDAEEGEKKALSGIYDVLILEDLPPGKDSYEICENYRQNSQAPVIFISKKEREEDIVHAFHVGADDYIIKRNFNLAELVARVKRRLRSYEILSKIDELGDDPEDEIIDCGGLRINVTKQRVFVDGVEKILTNKEYELLLFLANHPYQFYNKGELFEKIWEKPSHKEGNTVVTHIKRIRDKIERDPIGPPQFIVSKWGDGYRLENVR